MLKQLSLFVVMLNQFQPLLLRWFFMNRVWLQTSLSATLVSIVQGHGVGLRSPDETLKSNHT